MRVLGVGPSCGPASGGTQLTLYVELLPKDRGKARQSVWISFVAFDYESGEILEERFSKATFVYENELTCTAPAYSAPGFVELRVAGFEDLVPVDFVSPKSRQTKSVS